MAESVEQAVIGILGGTGPLGRGLATRWSDAGLTVIIGSREAARAQAAAEKIGPSVTGLQLEDCAARASIVVAAVPWSAHASTLERVRDQAAGKVLVDAVVPLGFDEHGPYALEVEEGSAAQQAQALLPGSRVVAAFHNVPALTLGDRAHASVDCDVLVAGDDPESVRLVQSLADAIPGMRGVNAGRLRGARQVEALTANLIAINKRYKTRASIAVTNLPL